MGAASITFTRASSQPHIKQLIYLTETGSRKRRGTSARKGRRESAHARKRRGGSGGDARGDGVRGDRAVTGGDDDDIRLCGRGRSEGSPEDGFRSQLPLLEDAVPVFLFVPVPHIAGHFSHLRTTRRPREPSAGIQEGWISRRRR